MKFHPSKEDRRHAWLGLTRHPPIQKVSDNDATRRRYWKQQKRKKKEERRRRKKKKKERKRRKKRTSQQNQSSLTCLVAVDGGGGVVLTVVLVVVARKQTLVQRAHIMNRSIQLHNWIEEVMMHWGKRKETNGRIHSWWIEVQKGCDLCLRARQGEQREKEGKAKRREEIQRYFKRQKSQADEEMKIMKRK